MHLLSKRFVVLLVVSSDSLLRCAFCIKDVSFLLCSEVTVHIDLSKELLA